MGYRNLIAAAIGGKPDAVKKFSAKVSSSKLSDKAEIFNRFQVITLRKDFAIFARYFDWVNWYENEEESWKNLTNLAEKAGLGYVFYRVGEDENDIEIRSNNHIADFDPSLFQIFSISSYIRRLYPELAILNMDVS